MTTPRASRSDRYGRRYYPVPHPQTKQLHDLPSYTTLKRLLASGALETWKLKGVARQIALRPDLQMLAAEEETVYQAVKQALDATNDRANVGTGVHRYCELADEGTLDMELVPGPAKPYLAHYLEAKADLGFEVVEAECTVYNFELGYACTPDRFLAWPGVGVVNADIKTGKDVYPDMAQQLAAGACGEGIWVPPADDELPEFVAARDALESSIASGRNVPAGRRKWSQEAIKEAKAVLDEAYWAQVCEWPGHRPMPEGIRTDLGVILHLTETACVPVFLKLDTDPPAISVIAGLRSIYGWQAVEKSVIQDAGAVEPPSTAPAVPPEVTASRELSEAANAGADVASIGVEEFARVLTVDERKAYLRERMLHTTKHAKATEHVAHFWPGDVPNLKGAPDHAALDKIERLLNEADGKFGIEFPAVSPTEFVEPTADEAVAIVTSAFPGAVELPANAHRRLVLGNRVSTLAGSKPEAADALMARLRAAGLAKSLRTGNWTNEELKALEAELTAAETGKAPKEKKGTHATA